MSKRNLKRKSRRGKRKMTRQWGRMRKRKKGKQRKMRKHKDTRYDVQVDGAAREVAKEVGFFLTAVLAYRGLNGQARLRWRPSLALWRREARSTTKPFL